MKKIFSLGILFTIPVYISLALKKNECEVCVTVVKKFSETLTDADKSDNRNVEELFKNYCQKVISEPKEKSFCYYLGGLEESATGILSELSRPLQYSKPADKICIDLKKKDAQICDLRYDKQIDLNTVDLKKLKVKDLKKILNDWNEVCGGCIEKTDFIKKIEELKLKHVKTEL